MTALELAEILGRHLLIAGNGYHRTRRCTCGWKTREAAAGDAHRLHVAEVVLGGDREAAMAAARAALVAAKGAEEEGL
jgi:hypothetical protein